MSQNQQFPTPPMGNNNYGFNTGTATPPQSQQQVQQQIQQPQQLPPNQSPAQTQNGAASNQPQQPPAQPAVPQKEFNILTLCRIGQETVQDIVTRFQEVFTLLKQVQPPNGHPNQFNSSMDKKLKVQEQFRTIRLLFKRLRLLYNKCNDSGQQGMEYIDTQSLIPLKDEPDSNRPDPIPTEEYKKALQENRELVEIVVAKNKQLREIIDRLRIIIWEINTMLSMRRS